MVLYKFASFSNIKLNQRTVIFFQGIKDTFALNFYCIIYILNSSVNLYFSIQDIHKLHFFFMFKLCQAKVYDLFIYKYPEWFHKFSAGYHDHLIEMAGAECAILQTGGLSACTAAFGLRLSVRHPHTDMRRQPCFCPCPAVSFVRSVFHP